MSTQPTTTTPEKGRGAWARMGFPIDPATGKGFTAMYQRHLTPPMTGSQSSLGMNYEAVNYGVKAVQMLLKITPVDGLFGPQTEAAVKAYQTKMLLGADGIAGPLTLKVALAPLFVNNTVKYGIVDRLLYGLVHQESMKDPGAVGYGTPSDKGLVQINMAVHSGTVTMAQAFDPTFSLDWAANRLRTQHDRYFARTGASRGNERLSWDCAVANHNSPAQADKWASTGTPPSDQIRDYVANVRKYALL